MYEKWKKAVIHLECASNSVYYFDMIKKIEELKTKLDNGEISQGTFFYERENLLKLDIRRHGTALFLIHNSKRYLITARHVVFDEERANYEMDKLQESFLTDESELERYRRTKDFFLTDMEEIERFEKLEKEINDLIINNIIRVPSLDEHLNNPVSSPYIPPFLMNLGAGLTDRLPYIFSSPELDLAVIALDRGNSDFAENLLKCGYEPISSEDVVNGPTQEGNDVFTVGFPSSVSTFRKMLSHGFDDISSNYFSQPSFSFGKVSMLHECLNFYWADLNISKGNSGGPVIENDKLIGILSAQAQELHNMPYNLKVSTGIPFARIIKAEFIWELLQTLEKRAF
jgi:hypothetical protein